jgi:hypothetical protein
VELAVDDASLKARPGSSGITQAERSFETMNTDITNGRDGAEEAGRAHPATRVSLDQAKIKAWLNTDVTLTVPRWTLVATGAAFVILLLIALD